MAGAWATRAEQLYDVTHGDGSCVEIARGLTEAVSRHLVEHEQNAGRFATRELSQPSWKGSAR
jgi:hypothetical protein